MEEKKEKYKILTYPDERLKRESKKIDKIDVKIMTIAKDMADIMFENSGVGLAAPQIGINKQIIVYRTVIEDGVRIFETLINPIILKSEGNYISEKEGCLSVPNLREDVKRAKKIKVEFLDINGVHKTVELEDIPSVIVQHEIDHLKGVLLLDKVSSLKRKIYNTKIRKSKKQ